MGFPCDSTGKESTSIAGDLGTIPELRRSSRGGKGYPLQDSGLENSMDCIVQGVSKSRTRLSNLHFLHIVFQMWLTLEMIFIKVLQTIMTEKTVFNICFQLISE